MISWEQHWGSPEKVQMGQTCGVHTHHEFVPMNVHHIWPKGLGSPDVASNKITLCMNGHGAVHAYLELLIKTNGEVPVNIAMHFGYKVRQLAYKGWEEAGKPTSGGSGE